MSPFEKEEYLVGLINKGRKAALEEVLMKIMALKKTNLNNEEKLTAVEETIISEIKVL